MNNNIGIKLFNLSDYLYSLEECFPSSVVLCLKYFAQDTPEVTLICNPWDSQAISDFKVVCMKGLFSVQCFSTSGSTVRYPACLNGWQTNVWDFLSNSCLSSYSRICEQLVSLFNWKLWVALQSFQKIIPITLIASF